VKEGLKYIIWTGIFLVSLYALSISGITRTKYIGVSIPVEVLVIILSSALLLVSQFISNRIFSWFNWLIFIGSTTPFLAFILFILVGSTFSYILLFIFYGLSLFGITYWKLISKKILTNHSSGTPNGAP